MNCKFCGAEMVEDKSVCPVCGKDNTLEETPVDETAEEVVVEEIAEEVVAEETVEEVAAEETVTGEEVTEEAPKAKTNKIAIAITAIVVVLALIVALLVGAFGGKETTDAAEPSTELSTTVEYTTPADTLADDVTHLGTYTVSDEEVLAAADTVVATMGDAELTLAELQIYYWTEVFNFLNSYGSYASYLGLDYTIGLDQQLCGMSETEMTWQQYFLGCALDTWSAYQALSLEADANGYVMDQETKDFLAAIPEDMATLAASYGFTSTEELLLANFGPGVTVDTYADHMYTYYNGYGYFSGIYDAVQFTDAEIEAYFDENAATYEENGVTKDSGKYVDVRHILITPETSDTDADGNAISTEEDWAAAEAKAQEVLDEWLNGDKTEESFAGMAAHHSQDPGSRGNGGLYENVYVGRMVPEFEAWCFDEGRKVGDYGIVKTDYGYHIMYFVGSADIWFVTAQDDMMNAAVENVVPDAVEKYEMDVDFASIKLGYLNLAS